jgi:alpha-tubulin suppressor-like RCC1 family protein
MFRNKNIQMVACGKYHTLFLIDGCVWATGVNKEGQIGNGTTQNQYKPVQIKGLNRIAKVSAWH